MGVQDRDWYHDHRDKQRAEEAAPPPKPAPPEMPGADWHWTVKLMFVTWCLMLLYLASKLAMGLPL